MRRILIDNITFGYNKRNLLFENLSIDFEDKSDSGYVYALMGPSGCGKTTLIKLILSIEKSLKGKIETNPIVPVISYIPQEPILFEHLSPLQNATFFDNLKNYHKIYDFNRFKYLAELLGLEKILKNATSINELSGGEKQRLAILRALSIQPDVLLFDEPLTGLEAESKNDILILIRDLVKKYKILVIYITHHFTEAQIIADEIIYINRNSNTIVSSVYKSITKEFIDLPPTLDAAISINFPDYNILPVIINNKGHISLAEDTEEASNYKSNTKYLFFNPSDVQLVKNNGFQIENIETSSLFVFFKLKGTKSIIKSKLYNFNDLNTIVINGKGLIYNLDRTLNYETIIRHNKIINYEHENSI